MATRVAAGLMAIYGLIVLVDGVIGYVKAESLLSLLAGGGSGLALLASAALTLRRPTLGLVIGGLVTLAHLGNFDQLLLVKALRTGG